MYNGNERKNMRIGCIFSDLHNITLDPLEALNLIARLISTDLVQRSNAFWSLCSMFTFNPADFAGT